MSQLGEITTAMQTRLQAFGVLKWIYPRQIASLWHLFPIDVASRMVSTTQNVTEAAAALTSSTKMKTPCAPIPTVS